MKNNFRQIDRRTDRQADRRCDSLAADFRRLKSNTKLIIRLVPEISSFEIFKMADFMTSLQTSLGLNLLFVISTYTLHTVEHCVKILSYSDKKCRRRSILKMRTDRQKDTMTNPQTDTSTDNKGR